MHFDVYFNEKDLHEPGRAGARPWTGCAQQGHVFEADGAIWLRTTDFGDDETGSLIRSNGE